ncbi:MAG: DUF2273 domain-containing protein [Clostridiaceae bacterium]|jgi:uncharacterized membrane protein|nr:DUF2273 domain-containing protein [Oscillospiraceae bacterium]NLO62683.1 DUF2273 domain-containing protein [Clostridiaceae bacterium]
MRAFFVKFLEMVKDRNAGLIGAGAGFILALLLVIFGFFKTLFILILTLTGFFLGVKLFSDKEKLKNFMDKLIPPGRFR